MAWRYEAPTGCPSQQRFRQELAARSPALDAPDASLAVHVTVSEPSAGSWRGEIRLEKGATHVAREITGADCDEVVVALALIASLWLPRSSEPGLTAGSVQVAPAERATAPDVASHAPTGPSERDETDVLADAALSPAPVEASPPVDESVLARAPAGAPSPDAPSPSRTSLRSGGDARVYMVGLLGYASEPAGALRGALRGELWGDDSPSSWATAVGVAYTAGQHQDDRFGTATLRAIHAQVDLCPPGLSVGRGWLRVCAFGRGGGLHFSAANANLDAPRSLWRPWVALGPSLHGGLAISRVVSLRAAAELAVNLIRDEFATERSSSGSEPTRGSTLYDTGPLSLDLSLGAAYAF